MTCLTFSPKPFSKWLSSSLLNSFKNAKYTLVSHSKGLIYGFKKGSGAKNSKSSFNRLYLVAKYNCLSSLSIKIRKTRRKLSAEGSSRLIPSNSCKISLRIPVNLSLTCSISIIASSTICSSKSNASYKFFVIP
ncbi:MAG: hypothetical protein BWY19_01028 [bacterium ADurb.Bin212]|nr:MAG: hypothetical protein BWY19_01028 [bacterium ADurb.Bin212]